MKNNTPRTDAEYQQWETLEEAARFSQELELDNDELRKAHHKYESTLHDLRSVLEVTTLESFVQAAQRLKRENAALRISSAQDALNYQCAMRAQMAVEEQLKRENAALREENAKLQKYVDYVERYADELTVNAARQEAQS